jgi:hypothetical protein
MRRNTRQHNLHSSMYHDSDNSNNYYVPQLQKNSKGDAVSYKQSVRMGNDQSIKDYKTVEINAGTCTPPSNTLSSLKATSTKEYSFSLPNNNCSTAQEISIDGDLGDRKFVTVDRTRCLLMHKEKTEAILLYNSQTRTIHICSFIPQGSNHGGLPLYEWGSVAKTRGGRRCRGYTMTTPYERELFRSMPEDADRRTKEQQPNNTCGPILSEQRYHMRNPRRDTIGMDVSDNVRSRSRHVGLLRRRSRCAPKLARLQQRRFDCGVCFVGTREKETHKESSKTMVLPVGFVLQKH